MTNEQARKLLGGYATNTLTEAERQALFEAALDNQELFDALQQEQALKDLLSDPVSRRQVQHALAQKPERAAWWSRGWAWGGLAGAVAAAVLIVAVIRTNPPTKVQIARVQPPAEMSAPASPPRQAAPPAPAPQPRKRTARRVVSAPIPKKDEVNSLAATPPPPPAAPVPSVQSQQLREPEAVRVQTGAGQVGPPQVQAPQPGFRANTARLESAPQAGLAGGSLAGDQAPLRYSLVLRDSSGAYTQLPPGATLSPGDSVRVVVTPGVAGYLSLDQLDSSGQLKRLAPQSERTLVGPNISLTLPEAPIVVQESEQRFRLTLAPAGAGSPIVIEVTIAPGKTR